MREAKISLTSWSTLSVSVKDGNSFEVVEHPVKANLDEYYEASTPIWKSDVFYLAVGQSINATSTIPEEYPTWVEIINNLINETEEAITRAENVNISSEQLSNGVKVITTNQNGEQTITIVPQGPQGEQGPAGSIKIIVVETLPTENIDTSAIYLVPSQEPTTQNNYEEYVYINNQWEKLGEVPIATDLTDYVKNTDYATASKGGVIRINSAYGVYIYNGQLYNNPISYSLYQNSQDTMFIGKGTLENVITGKGLVSNTIIKTTTNTTAGNVYDVTYINSQLGDIATALNTINGENI